MESKSLQEKLATFVGKKLLWVQHQPDNDVCTLVFEDLVVLSCSGGVEVVVDGPTVIQAELEDSLAQASNLVALAEIAKKHKKVEAPSVTPGPSEAGT